MDFLPMPHSVRKGEGVFALRYDTRIVLENTEPSAFLYAQMLQEDIQRFTGLKPAILRGKAQPGDVIVLAGKGHEDYQEINHQHFPMDERVIVAQHLKEM